jgi:hypothetical protein
MNRAILDDVTECAIKARRRTESVLSSKLNEHKTRARQTYDKPLEAVSFLYG